MQDIRQIGQKPARRAKRTALTQNIALAYDINDVTRAINGEYAAYNATRIRHRRLRIDASVFKSNTCNVFKCKFMLGDEMIAEELPVARRRVAATSRGGKGR